MAQVFHPAGKKVPKVRRVPRGTAEAGKGSRGRENSLQLSEKGGWEKEKARDR